MKPSKFYKKNTFYTEGGILHCFTGNVEQAQKLIDMGFYLGIGGVATYKNGGLEPVISHYALDHLVLETDAPYLRTDSIQRETQ